jgi:hypothetical protein
LREEVHEALVAVGAKRVGAVQDGACLAADLLVDLEQADAVLPAVVAALQPRCDRGVDVGLEAVTASGEVAASDLDRAIEDEEELVDLTSNDMRQSILPSYLERYYPRYTYNVAHLSWEILEAEGILGVDGRLGHLVGLTSEPLVLGLELLVARTLGVDLLLELHDELLIVDGLGIRVGHVCCWVSMYRS